MIDTRLMMARQLLQQYNRQMEKIGMNYLAQGVARTVEEAIKLTCDRHGATMAYQLQEALRNMGAKDVKVTCP